MNNAMQVRERPILFSGPMVRAILDGRKTQTRRVVVAPRWAGKTVDIDCLYDLASGIRPEPDPWPWANSLDGKGWWKMECPHGQTGDRLWVRETFADTNAGFRYRADFHEHADTRLRFKPSIFMPRVASRLTLEITDVRVERLQDISEADAMAEGACTHENPRCEIGVGRFMYAYEPGNHCRWELDAETAYRKLWDSLNAKRGFSWESNPWVWCIAFSVLAPDPPSGEVPSSVTSINNDNAL